MNNKVKYILLFCIYIKASILYAQINISLQSYSWKYTLENKRDAIQNNINDSSWQSFPPKAKSYTGHSDLMWLRTKVFIGIPKNTIALLLEKVCGYEKIYLNGNELEFTSQKTHFYSRCYRSVIYTIPKEFLNKDNNENTLAIRLQKVNPYYKIGLKGKMKIIDLKEAELIIWKNNLKGLVYSFLSFLMASILIIAYFFLYHRREYFSFASFLFLYSAYKLFQNPSIYNIADIYPIYSRIYICLQIMLPVSFFYFFVNFFNLEKIEFFFKNYSFSKNRKSFGKSYFLLSSLIASLCIIMPSLSNYLLIPKIYFYLQTPIFVYYLYIALQNLRIFFRESSSFLIASFLLLFSYLYVLFSQKSTHSDGGLPTLIFQLSIVLGLLYSIILRKIEVEKHHKYLKSIDALQDHIFGYIGSIISKPCQRIMEKIEDRYLSQGKFSSLDEEENKEIIQEISQIKLNLNSLIELARLEVLAKPEFISKINLFDFAQAVFANAKINTHIRISPETTIETGLDLLNSVSISLLEFLQLQDFQNMDVMINTEKENKILFHFLAYHKHSKKVQNVYHICTHINPLNNQFWIRWSIISEIIRILQGELYVKRIKNSFLQISILFPSSIRSNINKHNTNYDTNEKKIINLIRTDKEEKIQSNISKEDNPFLEEESPRIHAKMSLTELYQALRFKISYWQKKLSKKKLVLSI